MAIKKQEFYEGAALHLLARRGMITSIRYEPPLFWINNIVVLLKYSTKGRSPWGFTFLPLEQSLLDDKAGMVQTVIGLVCGADGVAAISYEAFRTVAESKEAPVHIACYRGHGEHYEICGPGGSLSKKVAPSQWQRILES